MKRLLFGAIIAFALMLGLSGCATLGQLPTGPNVVLNKAAFSVETAYQAAAFSLRTALRFGLIKGEAAARAAKADATAYTALVLGRAAYSASELVSSADQEAFKMELRDARQRSDLLHLEVQIAAAQAS